MEVIVASLLQEHIYNLQIIYLIKYIFFQILWNNKNTKMGGKQVMHKHLLAKKTRFFIHDLCNDEGAWLTYK